ncbi:MAG: nucleotidyltransferase family protein [Crocinitomicaceae bacterium]|nr:nucleotidyltransferase family protein [Crocinitomicaceae bacterium]
MQDKENNQPGKSEFAVIILAGGRSSRMNYPKPWLKYNDSENFTEAIIDKYNNAGIEEKVLVINADFCSSVYINQINRIKDKVNFAYILEPEARKIIFTGDGSETYQTS